MYDLDEVDAPEDSVDEVPEFMKPENEDADQAPDSTELDVDSSPDPGPDSDRDEE
jgi:hypothetical protein